MTHYLNIDSLLKWSLIFHFVWKEGETKRERSLLKSMEQSAHNETLVANSNVTRVEPATEQIDKRTPHGNRRKACRVELAIFGHLSCVSLILK